MNIRFKHTLLYLTFLITSILGLILVIERYPCIWLKFPHLEFFWKVYLDHFMAGFLLPIWMFLIFSGIILLFNRQVNLRNQKISIFIGFIATMFVAVVWDFVIPLCYLINYMWANNLNFNILIQTLNLFYWKPRYEFVQFLFDWGGILSSIIFIKSFREDLK